MPAAPAGKAAASTVAVGEVVGSAAAAAAYLAAGVDAAVLGVSYHQQAVAAAAAATAVGSAVVRPAAAVAGSAVVELSAVQARDAQAAELVAAPIGVDQHTAHGVHHMAVDAWGQSLMLTFNQHKHGRVVPPSRPATKVTG